jgi:hypothetical protein
MLDVTASDLEACGWGAYNTVTTKSGLVTIIDGLVVVFARLVRLTGGTRRSVAGRHHVWVPDVSLLLGAEALLGGPGYSPL